MKIKLSFVCFMFSFALFSQEVCEESVKQKSNEFTISKCSIDEWSGNEEVNINSSQLAIQVSTRARKSPLRNRVIRSNVLNHQNEIKDNATGLEVNNLDIEKKGIADVIPFDLADKPAVFEECENDHNLKSCFKEKIIKHIRKEFNYPEEALKSGIEGRVLTQFVINKEGNVSNISTRGPINGNVLENEAARIITTLPKFIPAQFKGKIVNVKFGIPIAFKIPNNKKKKTTVKKSTIKNFVSFTQVSKIPKFKNCKEHGRGVTCFNEEMIKHIQNHFNYPKYAIENGIEGKVWVSLIIDKEGNVRDVISRGPRNGAILEKEALKIISKLPLFVPGTQNGKAVNVKYVLPISFKLNQV